MNNTTLSPDSAEFRSLVGDLAGKVRGYLALMVGGPVLKAALLLAVTAALAALSSAWPPPESSRERRPGPWALSCCSRSGRSQSR